jgi:hypothetical protein
MAMPVPVPVTVPTPMVERAQGITRAIAALTIVQVIVGVLSLWLRSGTNRNLGRHVDVTMINMVVHMVVLMLYHLLLNNVAPR